MGNRGSKSDKVYLVKLKSNGTLSVKEQRVDGFSIIL